MAKQRTQLNINIDPDLLEKLKGEAMKSGKTLTEFVTDILKIEKGESPENSLEDRLMKIEQLLKSSEIQSQMISK